MFGGGSFGHAIIKKTSCIAVVSRRIAKQNFLFANIKLPSFYFNGVQFECGDPAPVLCLSLCVKVSEAARSEILIVDLTV